MAWAEEQSWFGLEDVVLEERDLALDAIQIEKEIVWETRNGDFIPISQMNTSHIKNSINMILKSNKKWRGRYLIPLQKELTQRTS